jgi:SAM-dependent methyltransferase
VNVRPRFRPEPIPVTLSDVYPIDFGRRTADLAMWLGLAQATPPFAPVVEVGVGDGRVLRSFPSSAPLYGLDLDPRFVYEARERGIEAFRGDAAERSSWSLLPVDAGFAFCAYSTLFLIPHARQADAVRNMIEHVRPGGTVAVETFLPSPTALAPSEVPVGNPNGIGHPWVRRTTYEVESRAADGSAGKTLIRRLYGPEREDWRMALDEAVYWRSPDAVRALFFEAGATGTVYQRGGDGIVPSGSVLTTWTRPLEAP